MTGVPRIPDAVLADMLQRLGVSVSAGIDLRRAWAAEARRVPRRFRPAVEAVAARLAAGDGLGEACAAAGGALPEIVSGMLLVGDRSGRIAEVLDELAKTLVRSLATRRAFRAALVGPVIRVLVALAAIVVVIAAPAMVGKGSADLLGLGLRGGRGIATVLVTAAIATCGALLLAVAVRGSWRRRGWAWTMGRRLPVVGAALVAAEAAAWCRAAALAAHAGIGAGEMVELASRVAPGMAADRRRLEALLRGGHGLPEALAACGSLPRVAIDALAVGETTGTTAEALDRVADRLEESAARGVAATVQAVGFAAWAGVACLVAGLVIRLATNYARMIGDLIGP